MTITNNACMQITTNYKRTTFTNYICTKSDKSKCDFFIHKDYLDGIEPCKNQCVTLCMSSEAIKYEKRERERKNEVRIDSIVDNTVNKFKKKISNNNKSTTKRKWME